MTRKTDEPRMSPCGPLVRLVQVGHGAVMSVLDPTSFADGGLEWRLRYGDPASVGLVAACVVSDYDFLTSDEITLTEATRRLRILRRARRLIAQGATNDPQE